MNITVKLRNKDCEEVEVTLPGKYEVCSRCEGKGKHVNPAVDGNGISPETFAEDPDFEEDYFAGVYDITCTRCHGKRVVPVINVAACTFAQKRLTIYQRRWEHAEYLYRQEVAAERRALGVA